MPRVLRRVQGLHSEIPLIHGVDTGGGSSHLPPQNGNGRRASYPPMEDPGSVGSYVCRVQYSVFSFCAPQKFFFLPPLLSSRFCPLATQREDHILWILTLSTTSFGIFQRCRISFPFRTLWLSSSWQRAEVEIHGRWHAET